MLTSVLLGLGLLAADLPAKPPAQAQAAAPKPAPAEALARYNEKKAQTPNTAAAQAKLAEWCEQNGLEAEAFVHYALVVQLDPARSAAWRKLGYKKHQGRWMTDAQIADEAEQLKANKTWAPLLKKIHKNVHGGPKKQEARTELESIVDPRAIPAVYREFGAGGASDQAIAIQVFGQIDTPLSSKVLALLAVYGKNPEVRRRATETLRGRDPDHYLTLLVGLLSDPLKYEVRPVGGPGSPGVLFVEGERANVRRFYAPPAPSVQFQPGDIVTYDASGLPVLIRPVARLASTLVNQTGTTKSGGVDTFNDFDAAARFSFSDLMIEAQRGAVSAEQQLEADVNQVKALNTTKKTFNDLVMSVARNASGKDLGDDPKDWRAALAKKGQYRKAPKKSPTKPTVDELVPLAYQPQFGELTFMTAVRAVSRAADS
ncbi:MAG: hypothetical protein P4L84_10050 [Isosphaeraceae bacterium]|nr:hypothetical protein [Isosphaeraceae bacterium]